MPFSPYQAGCRSGTPPPPSPPDNQAFERGGLSIGGVCSRSARVTAPSKPFLRSWSAMETPAWLAPTISILSSAENGLAMRTFLWRIGGLSRL